MLYTRGHEVLTESNNDPMHPGITTSGRIIIRSVEFHAVPRKEISCFEIEFDPEPYSDLRWIGDEVRRHVPADIDEESGRRWPTDTYSFHTSETEGNLGGGSTAVEILLYFASGLSGAVVKDIASQLLESLKGRVGNIRYGSLTPSLAPSEIERLGKLAIELELGHAASKLATIETANDRERYTFTLAVADPSANGSAIEVTFKQRGGEIIVVELRTGPRP